MARGLSTPTSTVNVKALLDNDQGSPGDDSAGQRASGDEACSDEDDFVGETTNQNGKRRRPISVSYVVFSFSSLLFMWLAFASFPPESRVFVH